MVLLGDKILFNLELHSILHPLPFFGTSSFQFSTNLGPALPNSSLLAKENWMRRCGIAVF